jgi:pyruvate/2-oxoglutarate dehydrogenase complex dihydrolipoamide dehydrogenase (E3) component
VADSYDLVVIGAGSAGLSAAPFAARLGAKVALVERDLPGGDCLYTGCVPSKTLIHAARVAWYMRQAERFGLPASNPKVDLGRVMDHVQEVIQRVYVHESAEALAEEGVEVVLAPGRFVDPHTVQAGDRTLRAKHVLICTGARASVPPIPGLVETPHESYETIFKLRRLPERLLVIGTGPIGLELALAFQRLGSQVTCFQRSELILTMADPEVARCGLTEREARERHGDDVRICTWPLELVDRAQTEDDRAGFIKVIHRRHGEILGAHIMAARAGEMIHEYVLAMERGINFGDLSGAIHVYPTYSSGNQQAAVVYRISSLLESRAGRLVTGLARWIR